MRRSSRAVDVGQYVFSFDSKCQEFSDLPAAISDCDESCEIQNGYPP